VPGLLLYLVESSAGSPLASAPRSTEDGCRERTGPVRDLPPDFPCPLCFGARPATPWAVWWVGMGGGQEGGPTRNFPLRALATRQPPAAGRESARPAPRPPASGRSPPGYGVPRPTAALRGRAIRPPADPGRHRPRPKDSPRQPPVFHLARSATSNRRGLLPGNAGVSPASVYRRYTAGRRGRQRSQGKSCPFVQICPRSDV
jgi:hypothetical protein